MKKILPIIITSLFWLLPGLGNAQPFIHYKFDKASPTLDDQGNINCEFINGAGITTDRLRGSVAVITEGSLEYISISDGTVLNASDEFTVAFWAKWTGTDGWSVFYSMSPADEAKDYYITPSAWGEKFYLIADGPDGWGWYGLDSPNVFPQNEWGHIAVVYKEGKYGVYYNGSLNGEFTDSQNTPKALEAGLFSIGAKVIPDGSGGISVNNAMGGMIDDFRVYKEALTSAQVSDLFMLEKVEPVLITDISLSTETGVTEQYKGRTLQMNYSYLPEDATDTTVIWSVTGNTGEAGIDQNGLLHCLVPGTVTVKAISSDEAQIEGQIEITVLDGVFYGENRLFSHYTFDNEGEDEMGNADLEFFDAVSTIDEFKGSVVVLSDMDSAYMKAKSPLLFDTLTEMTFSAWIYLEEGNESGDDWEPVYEFWNDTTQSHEYLSTNLWGNNYGLVSSNPAWTNISAQPQVPYNQWYHIAVTRKGNMATVYLDGEIYAGGDVGKTIGELNANAFYFGGNPDERREYKYVNGMLDDIMIFHKALEPSDILDLTKLNKPIPDINKQTNYADADVWYPLDSSGKDSIGDYDMNLFNEKYIRNYGGRGDVVVFSHTDTTYGLLSGNMPVSGEQFTFSGWVYWDSEYAETWQTFLEFYNTNTGDHFYLSPKIAWGDEYGIVFRPDDQNWQNMGSNVSFPRDTWTHVAFTFNEGYVVLYLNGEKVGEHSFTGKWSDLDPDEFYMGPNIREDRFYISTKGMFDDFVFFNQILTSFQIEALSEDRTASRPDVNNFVMEAEDYAFGQWSKGTYNQTDTSYAEWSGDKISIADANDQAMLYGLFDGEGVFHVWAHVLAEYDVDSAFCMSENDGDYSFSGRITGRPDWQWVKIYQTRVLTSGNHFLKTAPGIPGVKLDKLIITADFGFDPVLEYEKTDTEAPTTPGVPVISNITEKNALIVWDPSEDNEAVMAYDIMEGDRVLISSRVAVIRPELKASSSFDISVRAKDIQGNVSGKSGTGSFSTEDLEFRIDFNDPRQTIHHFGASDAWWAHWLTNWPEEKKEDIAKILFSSDTDQEGNPVGIALSNWRFQIGSEDIDNSGLSSGNWFRELGTYLQEDGTYDWTVQENTEYWLQKAHEYGVEHFVAWSNSPPYLMTKSGYSFRTPEVTSYNLDISGYAEYADYLAVIAKHFQDIGMPFDAVSPINEPQWSWQYEPGSGSQAGSYATNTEIAGVVKALNSSFEANEVDSKILITEAGNIGYLFSEADDSETDDQIDEFWDMSSPNYIGDLPYLANWVAGHSYWSNEDVNMSVNYRRNLKSKIDEVEGASLEYWQSEYSLLGGDHQEGRDPGTMESIDYGLWLARLIYFDLADAGATGWDFWTALSIPGASTHDERFGLLNWYPDPNDKTHTDGEYNVAKICWALGNYSRFVRPGYTRLGTSRSDGLNSIGAATNQLYTAFLAEDESELVIVAINYSEQSQNLSFVMENLPDYLSLDEYTVYVTDQDQNLTAYAGIQAGNPVLIEPKSIITLVASLKNTTGIDEKIDSGVILNHFNIYPNPAANQFTIRFEGEKASRIDVIDLCGRVVSSHTVSSDLNTISVSHLVTGTYIVAIRYNTKTEFSKLSIVK